MSGEDHRLVMPYDGVDILEEDDPGHDRMRETGLGGFLVVFTEISGGMEEFLGNDGRFELDRRKIIEDRLTLWTSSLVSPL